MVTKRTLLSRRALAGFSAVALGVTGVAALGTTAMAVGTGPDQPGAPTEGSLTIYKYDGLPTNQENNGTILEPLPNLPTLEGVEFTVQQVGINDGNDCTAVDLTDPAAWDDVPTTAGFPAPGEAGAGDLCFTGVSDADVTDSDGKIVFDNLPVGLYYVTETDFGDNPIIQPVEPFYVTIPYPTNGGVEDAEDYDWNYNPVVYPKNQTSEAPTKTIEDRPVDDELVVGSDVTWEIEAIIPGTKDDLNQASVYDQLDGRLSFVANSTVAKIVPEDSQDPEVPLVEGVDYDVVLTNNGLTVEWEFTTAGLAKANANKGGTIVVTFDTTVDSVGDGEIANAPGELGNGYGSKFNDEENPGGTTPYTYWGNLQITKIDQSDPEVTLANAEFAVTERPEGDACAADLGSQDVKATGTSDANGIVQWDAVTPTNPLGLWVANSDSALSSPAKDYCVYETKAPAGYTATGVQTVTITPNGGEALEIDFENVQKEGPELPITGSMGILLLSIIGGGLILTGVTVAARSRRNNVAA